MIRKCSPFTLKKNKMQHSSTCKSEPANAIVVPPPLLYPPKVVTVPRMGGGHQKTVQRGMCHNTVQLCLCCKLGKIFLRRFWRLCFPIDFILFMGQLTLSLPRGGGGRHGATDDGRCSRLAQPVRGGGRDGVGWGVWSIYCPDAGSSIGRVKWTTSTQLVYPLCGSLFWVFFVRGGAPA